MIAGVYTSGIQGYKDLNKRSRSNAASRRSFAFIIFPFFEAKGLHEAYEARKAENVRLNGGDIEARGRSRITVKCSQVQTQRRKHRGFGFSNL